MNTQASHIVTVFVACTTLLVCIYAHRHPATSVDFAIIHAFATAMIVASAPMCYGENIGCETLSREYKLANPDQIERLITHTSNINMPAFHAAIASGFLTHLSSIVLRYAVAFSGTVLPDHTRCVLHVGVDDDGIVRGVPCVPGSCSSVIAQLRRMLFDQIMAPSVKMLETCNKEPTDVLEPDEITYRSGRHWYVGRLLPDSVKREYYEQIEIIVRPVACSSVVRATLESRHSDMLASIRVFLLEQCAYVLQMNNYRHDLGRWMKQMQCYSGTPATIILMRNTTRADYVAYLHKQQRVQLDNAMSLAASFSNPLPACVGYLRELCDAIANTLVCNEQAERDALVERDYRVGVFVQRAIVALLDRFCVRTLYREPSSCEFIKSIVGAQIGHIGSASMFRALRALYASSSADEMRLLGLLEQKHDESLHTSNRSIELANIATRRFEELSDACPVIIDTDMSDVRNMFMQLRASFAIPRQNIVSQTDYFINVEKEYQNFINDVKRKRNKPASIAHVLQQYEPDDVVPFTLIWAITHADANQLFVPRFQRTHYIPVAEFAGRVFAYCEMMREDLMKMRPTELIEPTNPGIPFYSHPANVGAASMLSGCDMYVFEIHYPCATTGMRLVQCEAQAPTSTKRKGAKPGKQSSAGDDAGGWRGLQRVWCMRNGSRDPECV